MPPPDTPDAHSLLTGLAALVFSVLYLVSDVVEAAIPIFVIGLYVVQLPRIGRLGLVGAVGYAYTFVYFTGTVLFALVNGSKDWPALEDELGVWVVVHGAVMVLSGLASDLRSPARGSCRPGRGWL